MSLPPSEIPSGAMRFNSDSQKLEYWDGSQWVQVHTFSPNLATAGDPTPGARGIFPGGRSAPGNFMTDDMEMINIASTGDAVAFGDLSTDVFEAGSCSSSTRGLTIGGRTYPASTYQTAIQMYEFSSTGSIASFGDLASAQVFVSAVSNQTRGVMMGGLISSPYAGGTNNIDYVTIASSGTRSDFGELTFDYLAGLNNVSSPTRGLFAGGFAPHNGAPGAPAQPSIVTNRIQYITIASTGNSQDFGDMQQNTSYNSGCSNATRGVYAGNGASPSTKIELVTMASLGNTVRFGDLFTGAYALAAVSSPTRGVWGGGSGFKTDIQYINFVTEGNAVDFGNLTTGRAHQSGCSNAHGGL